MQLNRPLRSSTLLLLGAALLAASAPAQTDPCADQARIAQVATNLASQADLQFALAEAENIADPQERFDARLEAFAAYLDELDLSRAQHDARLAVCSRIGGGRYAPDIDPQDFVAVVDNPYFPLLPGSTRSFQKTTLGGDIETIDLEVLHVTREILGVTCTVVRDIARENGVIVEDTLDYYAQDTAGNVWYFGELALNFEGGYLRDLHGSWIAGEDGAAAGILMQGAPVVGTVYRQEFALGEAEDTAGITAIGVSVQVPYGNLNGCLTTFDFSALEPDLREQKTYAPGLGVVLEIDLVNGERLELISAT